MQLNKRLEVSVTPVAAKFQLPGPRSPSPTSGGSGSNSAAAAGGGEFPVHSRGGFSSSKRPFTSAPTSVLKQSVKRKSYQPRT